MSLPLCLPRAPPRAPSRALPRARPRARLLPPRALPLKVKDRYEVHHGVRISDAALVAAATYSQRYITDRFLPDKVGGHHVTYPPAPPPPH